MNNNQTDFDYGQEIGSNKRQFVNMKLRTYINTQRSESKLFKYKILYLNNV